MDKGFWASWLRIPRLEQKALLGALGLSLILYFAPDGLSWAKHEGAKLSGKDLAYVQAYAEFEAALAQAQAEEARAADPSAWQLKPFDPNTVSEAEMLLMGLPPKFRRKVLRYQEQGWEIKSKAALARWPQLSEIEYERLAPFLLLPETGQKPQAGKQPKAMLAKQSSKPLEPLRPFDPNTLSEAEIQALDLPPILKRKLAYYRRQDWPIRHKGQIAAWLSENPADYARIEPFLLLPDSLSRPARPLDNPSPNKAQKSVKYLDINRAGSEDWQQLPGIGAGRAQQIIRYRERLGGFNRIEQVAEVYRLPDSVYRAIQPWLQLGASPQLTCLPINRLEAEELAQHPYLRPFEAKAIVEYRQRNGPFRRAEELRILSVFNRPDSRLGELLPYVCVD